MEKSIVMISEISPNKTMRIEEEESEQIPGSKKEKKVIISGNFLTGLSVPLFLSHLEIKTDLQSLKSLLGLIENEDSGAELETPPNRTLIPDNWGLLGYIQQKTRKMKDFFEGKFQESDFPDIKHFLENATALREMMKEGQKRFNDKQSRLFYITMGVTILPNIIARITVKWEHILKNRDHKRYTIHRRRCIIHKSREPSIC